MIESIEIDLSVKSQHSNCLIHPLNTEISEQNSSILSLDQIKDLINQANDLGAKKVILYNTNKNPFPDMPPELIACSD